MKFSARRSAGFTLVEMLVVIAIIAILAAVITVSASAAINAAKRGKALNTANQIQSAILKYDTEYGVYPLEGGTGGTDVGFTSMTSASQSVQDLFYALCGNVNAYTPGTPTNQATAVSNARNVVFLTPKRSEVDTTGVPLNPFSSGGKNYYFCIAMDADYDGILGDSGTFLASMPDFVNWTNNTAVQYLSHGLTQSVAVWACCDPPNLATPTSSKSPTLWVHTY